MRKSKKVLALLLSMVMVFSAVGATLAASAAEDKTYTPDYTQDVTVDEVNVLISDVRTLLTGAVWTGLVDPVLQQDTLLKTVYGIYPGLTALGYQSDKAVYYTDNFGPLFKDLQNPVTSESLAAYLADKTIEVKDQEDLFAQLSVALTPLLADLVGSIIAQVVDIVNMFIESFGWDEAGEFGKFTFTPGLVDEYYTIQNPAQYSKELCVQLSAFVDYLRTDTAGKLLLAVRSLTDQENRKTFGVAYGGIANVVDMLIAFGVIPVTDEQKTMIMDFTKATKACNDAKTGFDFQKFLNVIGTTKFIPGETGNTAIGVTFDAINWSNLTDLDAENLDADTFMVVYNYIYRNLLGNQDNLAAIGNLISSLIPGGDGILALIKNMNQYQLLDMLAGTVHEIANPAVEVKDEATGAVLSAGAGVLLAGTQFKSKLVSSGETFDKVAAALKDQADAFNLYDLSLELNGEAVQPDGTVKVSLPVGSFDTSRTAVYAVDADGAVKVLDAKIADGMITIETQALGMVAVAQNLKAVEENPTEDNNGGQTTQKPSDEETTAGGKVEAPDTGDAAFGVMAALILLSGASVAVLRKKHSF